MSVNIGLPKIFGADHIAMEHTSLKELKILVFGFLFFIFSFKKALPLQLNQPGKYDTVTKRVFACMF